FSFRKEISMAKKVQALIGKLKNGSGWDVQAILFNKKEWSNAEEREKGMVENDYKSGRYDLTETENDYRYDQMDMSLFKFLNVVPAPAPRESLPPDEDELDLTENYTEDENGSERRRVSFRMSPSLHRKLKEFASSKDLSTNQAA